MIGFLRRVAAALGLTYTVLERRRLPDHDPFINLPFRHEQRVVALEHGVVGTVLHRHVDPESIEDVYVITTDDGSTLVVPEGGLRNAR